MSESRRPLNFREKFGYGMGAFTESTAQNALPQMMLPVFNILLGVSPILLGIAAAITRAWDAFSDPLMGYLSDNTRSRWGRRKPYILLGAIASGIFFAAIWLVPSGWSQSRYFWHFLIVSLLYYTATTVYCVPYIGMGYELSDDYHERTRLMGYRMFFVGLSGIGIGWMLRFTQLDIFSDGVQGMRVLGVITGLVFIFFALGPLLLVRRRGALEAAPVRREKISVRDAFGVFRVGPFVLLLLALGVGTVCTSTPGAFGTYIVIYHVCGGSLEFGSAVMGYTGMAAGILSIASIPAVNLVSRRCGKKNTLIFAFLIGIAGLGGSWWLYTPAHPYWSIAVGTLGSICMSSMYLLIFAMVADVCEYDLRRNGADRAGVFAAALSWTIKFGIMLALACSGYVLEYTGFDAALGPEQAEATLFRMRLIYAVLPASGFVVSACLVAFFPLNARSMKRLRELYNTDVTEPDRRSGQRDPDQKKS